MCGIAGVFSLRHGPDELRAAAVRMQEALIHRGPDDEGLWQSPSQQAVLAHRRLSILDLSSGGKQPMTTSDGRYTVCFNGEIYNFRELREALQNEGVAFTTTSDTEVVLRLFERDGEACTARLRGMFAFAIWDEVTRSAFLARDPLGIKPLYLHRGAGTLAFASELQALVRGQLFAPTLSGRAVQRYFETGSVPEPLTLINEVECLAAGHSAHWDASGYRTQPYWRLNLSSPALSAGSDPVALTREALLDSVRHHFISDVPVGIFLSGGIDSTALLALANTTGHQGCETFSITVDDAAADEGPIARRTAQHFDAEHHEMRLDAGVAQGLFARFLDHLDQPTIDGLNTYTVSALAHQHGMKVVLSGLGGDELFGGYSSFQTIPKMCRWHAMARSLPGLCPLLDMGQSKHRRLADFLRSPGTVEDAYSSLRGIFSKAEAAQLTTWITGREEVKTESKKWKAEGCIPDQISELELTRYMRNQLLRDSDVMSMAHGLELRVPFVDRVLLEAVADIPAAVRLQANKRLLTQAVPEVPDWVVNQKKRGFLFPYQKWLGSEWGQTFEHATRGAPVRMATWYQKWSVFVLQHTARKLINTSLPAEPS